MRILQRSLAERNRHTQTRQPENEFSVFRLPFARHHRSHLKRTARTRAVVPSVIGPVIGIGRELAGKCRIDSERTGNRFAALRQVGVGLVALRGFAFKFRLLFADCRHPPIRIDKRRLDFVPLPFGLAREIIGIGQCQRADGILSLVQRNIRVGFFQCDEYFRALKGVVHIR